MKIVKSNNIKYITFDNLEKADFVTHCFSTKCGGVSKGSYSSLNLGQKRGDQKNDVLENYNLLGKVVGFSPENIVCSNQIHGIKICHIKEADKGKGFFNSSDITDADGFITNCPDIVLTTYHADCVPLFFADPVNKAIGLAHAGWRGTVNEIGKAALIKLMEEFNCDPKNILVGIGPSLSQDSFEVDLPVVLEFKEKLPFSEKFICESKTKKNKFHIDLWEINKQSMVGMGVNEENIEISGLCTVKRHDLFYSHRVSGENRGSMAAFMKINPEHI